MSPRRSDPAAQLIADNITMLDSSDGVLRLTWLMSDQQAPIRYSIGEGIVRLLRNHGFMGASPEVEAVKELLQRWESTPALRRGAAAKELREALAGA